MKRHLTIAARAMLCALALMAAASPAAAQVAPGVYYDREIFESDDIDSGFVGIALNEFGAAILTAQDFGWGTWTPDGKTVIDHRLNERFRLEPSGEDGVLHMGRRLVRAPESRWPEGFDGFMTDGSLPLWMRDEGWKLSYYRMVLDIGEGRHDPALPYGGLDPSELSADVYFLCDIDLDDLPELIVRYGRYEAEHHAMVFKADDDGAVTCVGGAPFSHTAAWSDPNGGVILQRAHMGMNRFARMSIEDGRLKFEDIFEEDLNGGEPGREYKEPPEVIPGARPLTEHSISDLDAIETWREREWQ